MTEDFNTSFEKRVSYAESTIKEFLPKEEGRQKTVIEAMNYSVLAGGKRIRPVIMKEAFEMFGGQNEKKIKPFMAAIEMIHTYSLVHDDLPAMDNDEYRRGRKTTHAVYGAGMATLAGDGLLNYAFETALKSADVRNELSGAERAEYTERCFKALDILGNKAGIYGMVGGQCVDVEAEGKKVPADELIFIHENKTAAMIESSLLIGACMAGASDDDMKNIEKAGSNIGIAFQIQDDILDVIGDTKVLGKAVGSDEKNEKSTYVRIYGMDKSKKDVEELSNEAIDILEDIMKKNQKEDKFLVDLVKWMIYREK